jgi:hypothetical protein
MRSQIGKRMREGLPMQSRAKRHNRFDPLDTIIDDTDNESPVETPITAPNPAPIVVSTKHQFKDVFDLLDNEKCIFKRTSIGTKVLCKDQACYDKCIELLNTKLFEYHSYRNKANRLLTVYLHGLGKGLTSVVKNELTELKKVPVAINEIQTSNNDPCNGLYKAQFKRAEVTLGQLRSIEKINRTVVSWKPHRPRISGAPMQCYRCLMFGHGGENCKRAIACMDCASRDHLTRNCPSKNNNGVTEVKCFNCISNNISSNLNHRANDPSCPCRQQFLKIRQNAVNKLSVTKANTHQQFNLESNSFPELTSRSNNNWYFNRNPVYAPSTSSQKSTTSYAEQVKRSFIQPTPTLEYEENEDLFTIDELLDIFLTAVLELKKCKSRIEQIKILKNLISNVIP